MDTKQKMPGLVHFKATFINLEKLNNYRNLLDTTQVNKKFEKTR